MIHDPVLAIKVYDAPLDSSMRLLLTVYGGLHRMGQQAPYFSLTYHEHLLGNTALFESGGAGHDHILEHFPQFADLARLHLSDQWGVPMYALQNGWYFLAATLPEGGGEKYHAGNGIFGKTPEQCLVLFAEHLRIGMHTAEALRRDIIGTAYDAPSCNWHAGKQVLEQWIEGHKPTWKQEADACIEKHSLKEYE